MRKKLIVTILFAAFLLTACGTTKESKRMEVPKTTWGMTVEEALDAYEITAEEADSYEEGERSAFFTITDYELFGEEASKIYFNFIDVQDNGENRLCDVDIVYSDDADMEKVCKELESTYGKTVEQLTLYGGYQVLDDTLMEHEYEDSDTVKLWKGATVAEQIGEKKLEEYCGKWKEYQPNLTDENWDEFSKNAGMSTIICYNEEMKRVSFEGFNWVVYDQIEN